MRSRAVLVVVAFALLVAGTPASAQDGFTGVSFGGVAFAFGQELGESVNVTRVPAQPTERRGVLPPDAAHITFTLYGTGREGGRTPRVGFTDGTIRAYRVVDLAEDQAASAQVEALRALLEDRSTLETFMDFSDLDDPPLPRLPAETGAAQALRARATYIDTTELTGIAYVAGYRQDVFPFAAGDFIYSFVALSTDGEWAVAGDFVIEATTFPERVRARDARAMQRPGRWQDYLTQSVARLNAATPAEFSPSLTSIDALMESFTFIPTES